MKNILTLANLVTTLRIILSPIFIIMAIWGGNYLIGATVILTVAAITDFFDGKIARSYKTVSKLGTFLDPLADKILLSSVFISFAILKIIPFWPVILITFREFLITFLRITEFLKGKQLNTLYIGKLKTGIQFASIYLILLYMLVSTFINNPMLTQISFNCAITAFYIAALITVYSGLVYLKQSNKLYEFISTFSYIGYFPISPGTFASFITCAALFFMPEISISSGSFLLTLMFILGVFTSGKFAKKSHIDDPSCVVIDEVCGMFLVLFFAPKTIYSYILAFALFRFFDITKIPFIGKVEKKFNSGFGIMFDDILAAIFSIIIILSIKFLYFYI